MATLVSRKFYEYLFPTFMMTVATSLAMVLNSAIVGNLLGASALAAVNLNNPVINLISAAVNIFVFGGNTLIAITKGQLKDTEANKIFSILLVFGFLLTIAMLFLGLWKLNTIAGILSGWKSQELLTLTKEYLFPLVLSFPVLFLYLSISAVMRVDGFPKYSAFVLIISNVINVIIGYILIKYYHFGISGSSWGLFIGFLFGCLLLYYYLRSEDRTLKLLKFNFEDVKKNLPQILLTGLPNGATNIFMLLRIFILNLFILKIFNTTGVAVYSLCVSVVYFAYIFVRGSANTMLTIVGILFGEKDYKSVKQVLKTAFLVTFVSSIIFVLIFKFAPDLVCSLYGLKDESEIILTAKALSAFAICVPFFGANYLFMCYFQCTKREKFAFIISAFDNFVLVVSFVILFAQINTDLLWYGFPMSEIIMFLTILAYCYISSKKENSSFPLLLKDNDVKIFTASIDKKIEDAVKVSKEAVEFCSNSGISPEKSLKVGLIIEEISSNIIKVSKYSKNIADIHLQIDDNCVKIKFRDNDLKFNPIDYVEGMNNKILYSGLEIVKASVSQWNYVRNIGFNTLILKVD